MKEEEELVLVTSLGHGEVHDGEGGHYAEGDCFPLPVSIAKNLKQSGYVMKAPEGVKRNRWPSAPGQTLNEIAAQQTGPMTGKPIEDDGGDAQAKAQQIIASQGRAHIEPRDPLDRESAHSSEIGNGAEDEDGEGEEQEDAPQQRGGRNRGRNR